MTYSKFLSKSDFKIARECPVKLFYKRRGYPSNMDSNPYLELLANGGYMVGKLAQLRYPTGIEIKGNTSEAIERTRNLLKQENAILFEPAFEFQRLLARVDILIKQGRCIDVIEVKSKSYDKASHLEKGDNKYFGSNWDPYLADIAFQRHLVACLYPDHRVRAFMLMPDKQAMNPYEELITMFRLEVETLHGSGFRSVRVEFTGDPNIAINCGLLSLVDVNSILDERYAGIGNDAVQFLRFLPEDEADLKKPEPELGVKCSKCMYTATGSGHLSSGRDECWNGNTKHPRHILSLSNLGNFNRTGRNTPIGAIDQLLEEGVKSMDDSRDQLLELVGDKYHRRPQMQLIQGYESQDQSLTDILGKCVFPLYFIDFETSAMAIPYHQNMHPYSPVAFQWSCHTLHEDGRLEHREYLNTTDRFPSFEFARELRRCIGDYGGTIFTWTAYEHTQLRMIRQAMETHQQHDPGLEAWLEDHGLGNSRTIDLHELCKKFYFHPLMGGRTSIKVVLPAVLTGGNVGRIPGWLRDVGLLRFSEDGAIMDPYALLADPSIQECTFPVKDGTGAMHAYQEMLYGIHKDDQSIRQELADSLRRYCRLDTLAMVIVYEYWMQLDR